MPAIINTNMASLNAQRNLTTSQTALSTSLQRLSSGLRINSAKDDAAGMAISDRLTTQIRGLNQASRNANDGISLAQTAESAMGEVSSNLQRIRELAVQSANATNSASDRAALNAEVQQRIAELNRVASQTEFNGTSLLNGTFTAQSFQVGANQGQTVVVDSISSATAAALGLNGGNLNRYVATGTAVSGAIAAGGLTLNGADVGAVAGDAKAIATAINNTDSRFNATATNVQAAVAFTSVVGAPAVPATPMAITPGAFTEAVSSGSVTTIAPGAYVEAASNGVSATATTTAAINFVDATTSGNPTTITMTGPYVAAASDGNNATATHFQVGAFTEATSNAAAAIAGTSGAEGATGWVDVDLTGGGTFSVTVGGVELFTQTGGVVTTADMEIMMTDAKVGGANAAALAAAGIVATGTVAGDSMVFTKADGTDFTISVVNGGVGAGFGAGSLATGNNVISNGTPAVLDNTFTATIDGIALFSRAGTVGATVTKADLDGALATFLTNNAGYSQVSGSFATDDLKLAKADGTAIAVAIGSNFTAGAPGVAGAFAAGVETQAGVEAVAATGAFGITIGGIDLHASAIVAIGDTVTAAELDAELDVFLAANAGYTKVGGSFVDGDLVLQKSDGTAASMVVTNTANDGTINGVANATIAGAGGVPVNTTTDFTMDIDGLQLFTQSASLGTVTGAKLDAALDTFLANNAGYTKVSGSFATDDLVLSKADGSDIAITRSSNFTGGAGGTLNGGAAVSSNNGIEAVTASATFGIKIDNIDLVPSGIVALGDTVTAGELDTALTAFLGANSGYTKTGSFAGNDLAIQKLDGSAASMVVTKTTAGGTFGGLTTVAGAGGAPASGPNFTASIDGIQLYSEAASIGGRVTGAELDSALATFKANNAGYTSTGSFAAGDLVISKTDGTASALTIGSNFTGGTAGAFANETAGVVTGAGGVEASGASMDYALTLDGTAVNLTTPSGDGTLTGTELATAISAVSGFTASYDGTNLSITKADGSNFTLAETGAESAGAEGLAGTGTTYRGTVALNSSRELTIGGTTPGVAGLTAGTLAATASAYGAANVLTSAAANTLLEVVDSALQTVNNSRANLGSIQNRFESIINSLTTTSENLTSARSRILDTDFAAETAMLTRTQILQQAGTAMLAQANQLPNTVLSLLR